MVKEKNMSQIAYLWKEEKRQFVKKSTFAAYSLIVETHLMPAFGNLTEIAEKDVQEFVLNKLNKGLSQKTIKDMLIVLRMILKYGAKKNYCVYSPIDVIFPTDRERQELEVLSIANQKKIMRYVEENFTFRNLGIFICLSTPHSISSLRSFIQCMALVPLRFTRVLMVSQLRQMPEISKMKSYSPLKMLP